MGRQLLDGLQIEEESLDLLPHGRLVRISRNYVAKVV